MLIVGVWRVAWVGLVSELCDGDWFSYLKESRRIVRFGATVEIQ
jgi:hypothetical protein